MASAITCRDNIKKKSVTMTEAVTDLSAMWTPSESGGLFITMPVEMASCTERTIDTLASTQRHTTPDPTNQALMSVEICARPFNFN